MNLLILNKKNNLKTRKKEQKKVTPFFFVKKGTKDKKKTMLPTDKEFCKNLKTAIEDCKKVTDSSQWRTINFENKSEHTLHKSKNLCKYYQQIYEIKCTPPLPHIIRYNNPQITFF